jgi:hypothetical protein
MKIFLEGEDLSKGGQIFYLNCDNCFDKNKTKICSRIDYLLFSETDMNYMGVIGLISNELKEIIFTRLTSNEFNNYGTHTPKLIADKINKFLNRQDLIPQNMGGYTTVNDIDFRYHECQNCGSKLNLKEKVDFEKFILDEGKIITLSIFE